MEPGLFESIYEELLCRHLSDAGLALERKTTISADLEGIGLRSVFRADNIVESNVLVELESVETLLPVHHMQVLTHLRPTGIRLGLLINFNVDLLKNGFHRIVNGL